MATTNLELSQFLANDVPGWLTNYNSDMLKIDNGYGSLKNDVDTASGKADNAAIAASSADAKATAANNLAETAIEGMDALTTDIETANTNITNLQNALQTTNNNVTAVKTTADGAAADITAMENRVASADPPSGTSMETWISRTSGRLSDAEADIEKLEQPWHITTNPTDTTSSELYQIYNWDIEVDNNHKNFMALQGQVVFNQGKWSTDAYTENVLWTPYTLDSSFFDGMGTINSQQFPVWVADAEGYFGMHMAQLRVNDPLKTPKTAIVTTGLVTVIKGTAPTTTGWITVRIPPYMLYL